jgi:hypothetical protein
MPNQTAAKPANLPFPSVPAFWPMAMATTLLEQGSELYAKNLKFVDEEIKIHENLRPKLATPKPGTSRSADHGAGFHSPHRTRNWPPMNWKSAATGSSASRSEPTQRCGSSALWR